MCQSRYLFLRCSCVSHTCRSLQRKMLGSFSKLILIFGWTTGKVLYCFQTPPVKSFPTYDMILTGWSLFTWATCVTRGLILDFIYLFSIADPPLGSLGIQFNPVTTMTWLKGQALSCDGWLYWVLGVCLQIWGELTMSLLSSLEEPDFFLTIQHCILISLFSLLIKGVLLTNHDFPRSENCPCHLLFNYWMGNFFFVLRSRSWQREYAFMEKRSPKLCGHFTRGWRCVSSN